jgi:hypothetical protein
MSDTSLRCYRTRRSAILLPDASRPHRIGRASNLSWVSRPGNAQSNLNPAGGKRSDIVFGKSNRCRRVTNSVRKILYVPLFSGRGCTTPARRYPQPTAAVLPNRWPSTRWRGMPRLSCCSGSWQWPRPVRARQGNATTQHRVQDREP